MCQTMRKYFVTEITTIVTEEEIVQHTGKHHPFFCWQEVQNKVSVLDLVLFPLKTRLNNLLIIKFCFLTFHTTSQLFSKQVLQ